MGRESPSGKGATMEQKTRSWADRLALWVLEFVAFSFAGWIYETLENLCSVGGIYLRQSLGLPWCPIYGIGGMIMVAAAAPIMRACQKRGMPRAVEIVLVAFSVGLIALVTELAGSYLLEWLTGGFPWNYSGTWGNFEGRVAPLFTARFIVLGLIAAYLVAPGLTTWSEKHKTAAKRLAAVFVALFVVDCALEALNIWDPLEDLLEPFGIHHW